ncbi:hypothetical protein GN330_10830 [Nitratireductor sp. CAU 1489]|uniref:Fenitrothion hydrolase n=1 Tax=Nitratireductor arenosus TaxID=2682096 RepID=A0A844QI56_9HYPH|nr:hypothetical protein [Nitratireductor arenosus]MVA97738.1 hypothetical protein [Nitratireductor arenosus]
MRARALALAVGLLAATVAPAFAHVSDRAYVLLLPTGYYLVGGGLAVWLSFAVLALVPPALLDRLARWRSAGLAIRLDPRALTSTVSFLVFAGLIAAGLFGSRDPLSNPLPLVFWVFIWIGVVLFQGIFGNLWRWIEPWYGPWRLVMLMLGRPDGRPFLPYPPRAATWPASFGFAAFVWFELVYIAPADPEKLALAMAAYWGIAFCGMVAFGHRHWSRRAEFLSLLMTMVARMAFVEVNSSRPGRIGLRLCLPGARLASAPALSKSAAAFLLLTLSAISFDGLMRTFFWLSMAGVNPLEFPGRSAVVWSNSIGAAGAFVALWALFHGAVRAGARMAGAGPDDAALAGRLVWSLMPIVLGYHYSHHLPALLVDGQYALAAISDPFATGWNLFGTAGLHVAAALTAGADTAWLIWNLQSAAIIGGHLLAVAASHVIAWRCYGSAGRAAISQIPLAGLMVIYTVFGLWLLSTPTGY